MIDSVALTWGNERSSAAALVANPLTGRRVDGPPALELVELVEFSEVALRLGHDDGQVRSIEYERGVRHLGHWQIGDVDLMLSSTGKLEVRASLPKLLHLRNDLVLTADETRAALELLVATVRLAVGCVELTVANARLQRADYCYQWIVPSVAHVLSVMQRSFVPARKLISTHKMPGKGGGRSLVYGYGSRYAIRFYDKGAEMHGAGHLVPDGLLDRVLRGEVQERRRPALDAAREGAYLGPGLVSAIAEPFERWSMHEPEPVQGRTVHDLKNAVFGRWLAENPHELERLRYADGVSEPTWYRWKLLAQQYATLELRSWRPDVPADAHLLGMDPKRAPELAAHYPTLDEFYAHEAEQAAKRQRVLARAQAEHDERVRRQTRVPDAAELERYRREGENRRHDLARDELVTEYLLEQRAKARLAYTRLIALQQAERKEQMRLELGEIVERARGELAAEIRAGRRLAG